MIKHSLRIGNKVKVFGKIYTIKELGEFEAAMEETEGVFSYKDVQGVELTPSILQACGFGRWGAGSTILVHDNILLHEFDDNKYRLEEYSGRTVEIKYVHQIQNLFFALTGTELTINLEKVKV